MPVLGHTPVVTPLEGSELGALKLVLVLLHAAPVRMNDVARGVSWRGYALVFCVAEQRPWSSPSLKRTPEPSV